MVSNIKINSEDNHVPFFLKVKARSLYIKEVISQSIEFDRTNRTNLLSEIKNREIKLKKAKINFINIIILKVVNFVKKIFNKSYHSIDELIENNNKCTFFLKKIREIKNLNNINYQKKQCLYLSDGSLHFEKNLFEIQLIQYEYFFNQLKIFEKILLDDKKALSLETFTLLPACLKESLEKLFLLKNKTPLKKEVKLLNEKRENEDSILEILMKFYSKQINNYKKILNLDINDKNYSLLKAKIKKEIKREYLFINNLFQKKKNGTTIYDISIERVINNLPNFISNKPLTVTIVGIEYAGLIKQGGLAEAIEGLCRGLKEENSDNKIQVIFPKYKPLPENIEKNMGNPIQHFTSDGEIYNVFLQEINGIEIHFIDHDAFHLDSTLNIYGPDYPLMAQRFATFSQIAAEYIYELNNSDVIHLHDWHVSGVALKLKKQHKKEWKEGKIPPIVFTYHNNNRNSQGRVCTGPYSYDPVILGYQEKGIIKANENLFIKTLKIADAVTTVSENFAKESQRIDYGNGISFAVKEAAKVGKLTGILNGTDTNRWNPESDHHLKNFRDIDTGDRVDLSYGIHSENLFLKRKNAKNQLQKCLKHYFPGKKIDLSKPLVTFIGRYDSSQKGLDQFDDAIKAILENGGQFLSIGTNPDKEANKILKKIEKKYPEGVLIIRDTKIKETGKLFYQDGNETRLGIGSLIRASSDFIFIPSSFEPCGLTQFEGWLFGSLAIASKTGGLKDSIITLKKNKEKFNGYLFERGEIDKNSSLSIVIKEALTNWKLTTEQSHSDLMRELIINGKQNSWTSNKNDLSPVQKYTIVYENAKKRISFRNQAQNHDKIDLLRYKLSSQVNKKNLNTEKEESYLAKYYSKEYDSESLDMDFQKLPSKIRPQVPFPYGVQVNFNEYEKYGTFLVTEGTKFNLYAPKAKKIKLILVDDNGVITGKYALKQQDNDWSITLPFVKEGQKYYYLINGFKKIDPYARYFAKYDKKIAKLPLSVVTHCTFAWTDSDWLSKREKSVHSSMPMSIYELYPGYWKRNNGEALNYKELGVEVVNYCKKMGYTHVELMGILEHLSDSSWGYQVTGYFAPTSRYGSIEDFKFLINFLHQNKIGVILDWIPAHFDKADFGLKDFDGSNLYNANGLKYSLSIRRHFFKYGSKHFDFQKKKIREFLISSAIYWLKEMHIDVLRVDCIRSILESENKRSAHLFLRDLNAIIHKNMIGCYTIAEDFSGDRRMTASFGQLGFGFDRKWHAGWMHGTMSYFSKTCKERKKRYSNIYELINCDNFSKQVMFLSHDQVKSVEYKNLIDLFPNCKNQIEKFVNLRNMLSFMYCLPGKKLIFMGEDSGLNRPWDTYVNTKESIQENIDLNCIETQKTQKMIKRLNDIYQNEKAMNEFDDNGNSLECIEDDKKIIHAYRRKSSDGEACLILHNFTDEKVANFKISFSKIKNNEKIKLRQIFNSEVEDLDSNNIFKILNSTDNSYTIEIPPLSTIIIKEEYV